MEDVDYNGWIQYIIDVAELFDVKLSPLLDITCGTGNSILPFKENNIKITGVDNSLEMLKFAKLKLPESTFIQASAQNLPFSRYFNLAISIFDSLNYILEYKDLLDAFYSVAESLLPESHFIFDMNTPYGLEIISHHNIRRENEGIISVWRNLYNKKEKLLILHLTLFIKKVNMWSRIDEIHRERGYSEYDVVMGLKKTGFKVLGTFKCFEQSNVDRFTKRILYVAKVV
jgi:ubiquinone/menaquinone biosynthesis C-methylase UbiE